MIFECEMRVVFEMGVARVRFLNGIVLQVVTDRREIHSLILGCNERRFKGFMQSALPPQVLSFVKLHVDVRHHGLTFYFFCFNDMENTGSLRQKTDVSFSLFRILFRNEDILSRQATLK